MKKEDLKNGMIIRSKTLKTSYVITDAKTISVVSISSGESTHIPSQLLDDFELTAKEPDFVYVVTIRVKQGEEFAEQFYYGVFESREKAMKYFGYEKRDWMERMALHYNKENDIVGVYTCNDHKVEIFGNEEHKDVVIIEMREKQIQ